MSFGMASASMPPPRPLSRRGFLGAAAAAAGMAVESALARAGARDLDAREHLAGPRLRIPAATANGGKVPVTVEMEHPMDGDHHVSRLEVVNPRDPVPSKGVFHFTPASGRAYVAFQTRVHDGLSSMTATAGCTRNSRFTTSQDISIAPGGGGCAGAAPASFTAEADEIRPPVIRLPQLVGDGRLHRDQVVLVQVKMKHPNRTGLALRDGGFVQVSEPFHLDSLRAFYGGEPLCEFVLTAALSDHPFITFTLRARAEALLDVVLTNTRGRRFEARHAIRFT